MAYFRNTILPTGTGEDVCDAITKWFADKGFIVDTKRAFFDFSFDSHERRAYVIWNDHRTVVVHSAEDEDAVELRNALCGFSFVLQVWAKDGAWGYRLDESGTPTAVFFSKASLANAEGTILNSNAGLQRLGQAFGITEAKSRLGRIQKKRTLLKEKSCQSLCDVLGVPLGTIRFGDIDQEYDGANEIRSISEWRMRMLSFQQPDGKPSAVGFVDESILQTARNLTEEDRAKIQKTAKKVRWIMRLISPLIAIVGFFLMLLIGVAVLGARTRKLRRVFLGAGVSKVDVFLDQLRTTAKPDVQLQGQTLINERYSCSVSVPEEVSPLTDLRVYKYKSHDQPVFAFEAGESFLNCTAHRPQQLPKWGGTTLLADEPISAGSIRGRFQKHRSKNTKHPSFICEWTLQTSEASYCFRYHSGQQLSPDREKLFEGIVKSFKTNRP